MRAGGSPGQRVVGLDLRPGIAERLEEVVLDIVSEVPN
jgi:predicted methyltransferase